MDDEGQTDFFKEIQSTLDIEESLVSGKSSFISRFPLYREKVLKEMWGIKPQEIKL